MQLNFFLVVLMATTYVHQAGFQTLTPSSRLALLRAVVAKQELAIDQWHTSTTDKAYHDGHYYSDKAPGTAALTLPAFAAAAGVLRLAGVDLDSKTGWLATSWAA